MKEAALVIIKPDGMTKRLVGSILTKFSHPKLQIVAMRITRPTRALAEEHYKHIKGQSFFDDTVTYFLGRYHTENNLLAVIYYGENATSRCRKIAGATNPEEAEPKSIRGAFGRITSDGIFENVVHVSSNKDEARREIQLWFDPDDIAIDLYPTKIIKNIKGKRVWK